MRTRLKSCVCWLALGAVLGAPLPVTAQDDEPDPNVPVQNRPRPEYDPLGIRARSFFIFPSITVEGGYDDNVFATDNGEEDDFFTTVTPGIDIRSDWSRHQLGLNLGGELRRYLDNDEQNYEDAFADLTGRLDITRDDALSGIIGARRLHEDASSPDSVDGDGIDVTEYTEYETGLSYRHDFARFYTQIGGDLLRQDFEDHNGINEDDRDRNQYRGRVRVGLEVSPRIETFVEGIADARRYDEQPNDQGVDRNSEGYAARAGVDVDITSILFGEFALGYGYRTYSDSDLDSFGGLSADGAITWNVTDLTSLIFTAEADTRETTVTFEDDEASGNRRYTAGVEVWHELLRNVLLNGNAAYIRDDFEGTSRTDDSLAAGAGVTYLLNRRLSLDGTYEFDTRTSDDNDEEYIRNIFRVGLTAQL